MSRNHVIGLAIAGVLAGMCIFTGRCSEAAFGKIMDLCTYMVVGVMANATPAMKGTGVHG